MAAVAQAMFLSAHDLRVVLVTVSASAAVSLALGVVFGRRLAASAVWAQEARERERRLDQLFGCRVRRVTRHVRGPDGHFVR